jgi:hypothetical protein
MRQPGAAARRHHDRPEMTGRQGGRIRRTPCPATARPITEAGTGQAIARPAGRTSLPARRQADRPAGPGSGRSDRGSRSPGRQPGPAIMLADAPAAGRNPAASAAPPDLPGSRRQDHSS